MTDRTFASLVPRIQASVPGCPHPMIVNYIRDAAIRTCEKTLYWRYQTRPYRLQFGVGEYTFNKPSNTDVHVVIELSVNGQLITRVTPEDAIRMHPQRGDFLSQQDATTLWEGVTPTGVLNAPEFNEVGANNQVLPLDGAPAVVDATIDNVGAPQIISQVTPDKYVILPIPDDGGYVCRMFLALKPKRSATGMDEVVFNELEDVITHGVLQHLLTVPDQTWTDANLAGYHAKQYIAQIGERRARVNLGTTRGTMRVQMQPFGV